MTINLFWGCDYRRQYEREWIVQLLGKKNVLEYFSFENRLNYKGYNVLVESGLLRLERSPSVDQLVKQREERVSRIKLLQDLGNFIVIHISDEEGFDGDEFYDQLPKNIPIWRNFWHSRFDSDPRLRYFPIGPRNIFLLNNKNNYSIASKRKYPCIFMGTVWASGSRKYALDLFRKNIPNGFYYSSTNFSQGLPLDQYSTLISNSVFCLAPEGDRHLDTFRLWESLSCGCIPLIVDYKFTVQRLIEQPHPLPVFVSWEDALAFARQMLMAPYHLDALQNKIAKWWERYLSELSITIKSSTLN